MWWGRSAHPQEQPRDSPHHSIREGVTVCTQQCEGLNWGSDPWCWAVVQVGVTALGRGLFGGGGKVLALDRGGGCVACGCARCPCCVTSQVVPIVTLSLPSVNSNMHETSAAGNPADQQRLVGRLWRRWG